MWKDFFKLERRLFNTGNIVFTLEFNYTFNNFVRINSISRFTLLKKSKTKKYSWLNTRRFFCFSVCQLVCWLLCCSQCTAKWTVHRLWQPIPTTRASPRVSPLFPKAISKPKLLCDRKTRVVTFVWHIKDITERTDARTHSLRVLHVYYSFAL